MAVDIVMRVALLYRLCFVAVVAFAAAKLWLLTGGRCALFMCLSLFCLLFCNSKKG